MATNNYIIRALSNTLDWEFGNGLNNYASNNAAVAYDIQMSLSMFLGDCFFALGNGIDWLNLLGGKSEVAIQLAINGALLRVDGVTGILNTNFSLTEDRNLSVSYNVQTVYSTLQGTYVYSLGLAGS